jgi:hypothetical protein
MKFFHCADFFHCGVEHYEGHPEIVWARLGFLPKKLEVWRISGGKPSQIRAVGPGARSPRLISYLMTYLLN